MSISAFFFTLGVAGVIIVGCFGAKPGVLTGALPAAPTRIVDAHTHFGETPKGQADPSPTMLADFASAGVVGAIVHISSDENQARLFAPGNSAAKWAVCAAVVPGQTVAKVEAGLRSGSFHCMKVYLGYVPRYASDAFYRPFYRLAAKHDVPVVFHTGDTYDSDALVKYAEPLQIDEVAVAHRDVRFVIAHMGNPWIQSAAEVVYKNVNVYADTSALMLGDVSQSSPESVDALVTQPIRWFAHFVENPRKILFGSDWPLLNIRAYRDAVAKAIPREHWDDVFYNNAVEVFKLDLPHPERPPLK